MSIEAAAASRPHTTAPITRQTAIVVTTIFEPEFLAGFLADLSENGRADTTSLVIIGDRKTPPSVAEAAAAARRQGYAVECPTLEEQDQFLRRLDVADQFIPYNSDNRRNIGFLMALESGCEVLISIDDDNFCSPGVDFAGAHQVVGSEVTADVVESSDRWFNICSLLKTDAAGETFARGFPYFAQRQRRQVQSIDSPQPLKVAVNAGLWLDEPDVDAVFRLAQRPKVESYSGQVAVLGPDVWSPVNTQNTALTREAALTYYYIRMGFPLRGLSIDRFGDILSGYFTQKCVKHLGQAIRFGDPILDHRRTPHNLFKDLYHELAGIVLIEEFLPWLMEVPLEGTTSLAAYQSLAQRMADDAAQFTGFIWDDGGRDFLRETAGRMQQWVRVVQRFADV